MGLDRSMHERVRGDSHEPEVGGPDSATGAEWHSLLLSGTNKTHTFLKEKLTLNYRWDILTSY